MHPSYIMRAPWKAYKKLPKPSVYKVTRLKKKQTFSQWQNIYHLTHHPPHCKNPYFPCTLTLLTWRVFYSISLHCYNTPCLSHTVQMEYYIVILIGGLDKEIARFDLSLLVHSFSILQHSTRNTRGAFSLCGEPKGDFSLLESLPWLVVTPDQPCSPPHSSCKIGDRVNGGNQRCDWIERQKKTCQGGKIWDMWRIGGRTQR